MVSERFICVFVKEVVAMPVLSSSVPLFLVTLREFSLTAGSVLLLLVAVALLVAEIVGPTHGTAAAGGVVVLIAAALLRSQDGGSEPTVLLVLLGIALVVFAAFCVFEVVQLRKRRVVTGVAGLLDTLGAVREPLTPVGSVFINGERWRAVTPDGAHLPAGTPVRVLAVEGLLLVVAPAVPTETTLPPPPVSPLMVSGVMVNERMPS